jgi:hypothetical protein
LFQHPVAVLKDGHLGAGTSGDMRKLRGNVPPADQDDAARQRFERKELFVGDQVFLARDA